jgi:hypothetical protein
MIVFSLGMSTLAGLCAFVIAYEQASRRLKKRDAQRYALQAVPGPFLFFCFLGVALGYAVPMFIHP